MGARGAIGAMCAKGAQTFFVVFDPFVGFVVQK
jgi:hypothetical protein